MLPASTQWELVKRAAGWLRPVLNELIRQAAQGSVIHNDDTGTRILRLARNADDGRPTAKPKRVFGQYRRKCFRVGLYARVSTPDQQTLPLQMRTRQVLLEVLNNRVPHEF
jgi:DNA invertase Pin-like site-specific DNA recombinase